MQLDRLQMTVSSSYLIPSLGRLGKGKYIYASRFQRQVTISEISIWKADDNF